MPRRLILRSFQSPGDVLMLTAAVRDVHLAELGLREGFWIVIAGGKYDFTAKWWDPKAYQAVVDHFQARIQFAQCGEAGHWHPRLKGVVDLVGRTSLRDFVVLMHHAAGVLCPVTFAMHLAAAVETLPRRPRRPCVVVAGAREPAHWEQYPGHQFLHTLGSLPCCANDPCWRSRCQLVGDGDEKDRREVCERPVQLTPELRIAEGMAMITPHDVIRAIERYTACGDSSPLSTVAQRPSRRAYDLRPTHGAAGRNGDGVAIKCDGRSDQKAAPRQEKAAIDRAHSKAVPVLIESRHGLGDAVQLTSVLLHLRHYRPDWRIDVAAGIGKLPLPPAEGRREGGPHENLSDIAEDRPALYDRLLIRGRDPIDRRAYHQVFDISWDECHECYTDSPSTKAERCLRTLFGLKPIAGLCRYELSIGAEAMAEAAAYLKSICGTSGSTHAADPKSKIENPKSPGRYPVVLLHYQGNTSPDKKDLPHDLARRVCGVAIEAGYVPVILDWDKRSPLPDGVRIFNPGADHPLWGDSGTGDCERLAALIAQSSLLVGIDSGPLHVAGAAIHNPDSRIQNPPTIAVWTGHHPLHYFAPADHVTHLVPEDHASRLRGDRAAGLVFFEEHYRYRAYRKLPVDLPAIVAGLLTGEELSRPEGRRFRAISGQPVTAKATTWNTRKPDSITLDSATGSVSMAGG